MNQDHKEKRKKGKRKYQIYKRIVFGSEFIGIFFLIIFFVINFTSQWDSAVFFIGLFSVIFCIGLTLDFLEYFVKDYLIKPLETNNGADCFFFHIDFEISETLPKMPYEDQLYLANSFFEFCVIYDHQIRRFLRIRDERTFLCYTLDKLKKRKVRSKEHIMDLLEDLQDRLEYFYQIEISLTHLYRIFLSIADTTWSLERRFIAQFFEIVRINRHLQKHELISYCNTLRVSSVHFSNP